MSKDEKNVINIIYHDENYKDFPKDITQDCQFIIKKTKGTLIFTKNIENLKFLLSFIDKNLPKSKSVLIMNGSSSEKVISLIKKNNYMKLFIKSCIYSQSLEKYQKVLDANKDFVENICVNVDTVVAFILSSFDIIETNPKFDCNIIMNIYSINYEYISLYKSIANFYAKSESINNSQFNPDSLKDINNNQKEIYFKIFNFYNSLKDKDDAEFILKYFNEGNLSVLLNQLLIKKEKTDFENVGYFVGNLMYRIVNYGKVEKKGVIYGREFFKGMQLNIFELHEFIKNENNLISYSHFVTMTSKKDLSTLNSQRDQDLICRNDKTLFSVIFKIQYLYDDGFEPSIFYIGNFNPYPDEEEYIVLPFTFFAIKKIKIEEKKMNADIDLEIIGKQQILEEEIKNGKKLVFDEGKHIMTVK